MVPSVLVAPLVPPLPSTMMLTVAQAPGNLKTNAMLARSSTDRHLDRVRPAAFDKLASSSDSPVHEFGDDEYNI